MKKILLIFSGILGLLSVIAVFTVLIVDMVEIPTADTTQSTSTTQTTTVGNNLTSSLHPSQNTNSDKVTQQPTQKTTTTSQNDALKKTTSTQKPAHTHSYSKKVVAATCTEKGYTIYNCSCGDTYKSNYANPSHSYTEFICRSCGKIDKANAHKYLVEYVKSKGTPNGTFSSIIMKEDGKQKFELKYDAQNKSLWATCLTTSQASTYSTALLLEDGYYGVDYTHLASGAGSRLTGFIEPKTFNENTAMTYETYTGLDTAKISILNLARTNLALIIMRMEEYFDVNDVGVNACALGYIGMQ